MLCYIGCGNETEPELDPRDNKLKPCITCQRAIADCYFGLMTEQEKEELLTEQAFYTFVQEDFEAVVDYTAHRDTPTV